MRLRHLLLQIYYRTSRLPKNLQVREREEKKEEAEENEERNDENVRKAMGLWDGGKLASVYLLYSILISISVPFSSIQFGTYGT